MKIRPVTLNAAAGAAKSTLAPPWPTKEHWSVTLMRYIITSRRQGKQLDPAQFRAFDALVKDNLDEICHSWGDRWITSIMDTYAENGIGLAAVCSAIRMMEQFQRQKAPDQAGRRAAPTADNHLNIFDRLERDLPPHLWRMFKHFWITLCEAGNETILGRFREFACRDIVRNLEDRDAWKDTPPRSIKPHTQINPCLPHGRPPASLVQTASERTWNSTSCTAGSTPAPPPSA